MCSANDKPTSLIAMPLLLNGWTDHDNWHLEDNLVLLKQLGVYK